MEITTIDQEVTDFDWYAIDPNGHLIQFASGGGSLPLSVVSSSEALEQLHRYFLALPVKNLAVHINPNLAQVVKGMSDINRYIESSVGYANRGLYAFDKTDLAHQDNLYHLVARPDNPLLCNELPTHIIALVSRTRLPFAIAGLSTVDVDSIK
jgi:hypothetical protein